MITHIPLVQYTLYVCVLPQPLRLVVCYYFIVLAIRCQINIMMKPCAQMCNCAHCVKIQTIEGCQNYSPLNGTTLKIKSNRIYLQSCQKINYYGYVYFFVI